MSSVCLRNQRDDRWIRQRLHHHLSDPVACLTCSPGNCLRRALGCRAKLKRERQAEARRVRALRRKSKTQAAGGGGGEGQAEGGGGRQAAAAAAAGLAGGGASGGRPEHLYADFDAAVWPSPQHGLSSKKTALITSDCGTMRSLGIKWP